MRNDRIHETHPDIIKRLKRVAGHLDAIVAMLEADRPCLELAQQLYAVENAVANAKKVLIHDHIDHCLEEAVGPVPSSSRKSLQAFKEITKYL